MNFFDKMYVGFQRQRYSSADQPRILGFAVPFDETKSSKSRQQTVDSWRQKDIEPRILENKPTRGFKLLEVVSRYSTSNKLFRVQDPRGFELEITSDNLLDLCLKGNIVKGEIFGECVWASAGKIYLMPVDDVRYLQHIRSKTEGNAKLKEGEYYVNPGNGISVFRYDGIFHNTYIEYKHVVTSMTKESTRSYWHSYAYDVKIHSYRTDTNIKMNSGGKPSYVYVEFLLDDNEEVKSKIVHVRKSHFKNMTAYDKLPSEDMKNYNPDMTQWSTVGKYWEDRSDKTDRINHNSPGVYNAYFKKKEDAKSFDYSSIAQNILPRERYTSEFDFDEILKTEERGGRYIRNVDYLSATRDLNIEDRR